MNNAKLNELKSTIASLIAQKGVIHDNVIAKALDERIKALETEIAAAVTVDSVPVILTKKVNDLLPGAEALSCFDDSDSRVALSLTNSMIRTALYGVFRNDAWHQSLSSRMGQHVSRSAGWAMQESTQYTNPEDQIIECQRQTEAIINELPRLIKTAELLMERCAAEGIELNEYDMPPTAEQVYSSYKVSAEGKRIRCESERLVLRAATPSILSMI